MTDSEVMIEFDDYKINLKNLNEESDDFNVNNSGICFLLKEKGVKYIGKMANKISKEYQNFDKLITITVPSQLNLEYLEYIFVKEAIQNEIKLDSKHQIIEPNISKEQKNAINEFRDKILFILKNFGYDIFSLTNNYKSVDKSHSGKTRHKWSKEISNIKFTAKLKSGSCEVIWKSKNELVLLSGAKLVENPQMNKDGTINYSAQFAQKLRLDNLDKIIDNVTTVDIVFMSPNQLGMFVFFGGQNTWAELKDSNGKTLDEWSKVG